MPDSDPPELHPTLAFDLYKARTNKKLRKQESANQSDPGSIFGSEIAALLYGRLRIFAFFLALALALIFAHGLLFATTRLTLLRACLLVSSCASYWYLRRRPSLELGSLRNVELSLLAVFAVQTTATQVSGMEFEGPVGSTVDIPLQTVFAFTTWIVGFLPTRYLFQTPGNVH